MKQVFRDNILTEKLKSKQALFLHQAGQWSVKFLGRQNSDFSPAFNLSAHHLPPTLHQYPGVSLKYLFAKRNEDFTGTEEQL